MAINEVAVVCPVRALRECIEDVVHLLVRLRRGLIVKLSGWDCVLVGALQGHSERWLHVPAAQHHCCHRKHCKLP
jgi:hypothetical protein